MGSWSESCGVSGVEIGDGEGAYMALLRQRTQADYNLEFGCQTHFVMTSLPLRGRYDDYGYFLVDDDSQIVNLFVQQTGVVINDDGIIDREAVDAVKMERLWIHMDIMEGLGVIKPDFGYHYDRIKNESIKYDSIQDGIQLSIDSQRTRFREMVSKFRGSDSDLLPHIMALMEMSEGSSDGALSKFYSDLRHQLITTDGDPEPMLEAKRRGMLLNSAMYELRKKLIPSERLGPQHGGAEASRQFAHLVLEVQDRRRALRDDWEDEE